ncbi:methyl-accepting chemotaxis protein [Methylobacterium radiotolerans]|uniref:methyl-accepting chemotaxis protein n=1 Tax=Methylobacterium radiotolerans TaxID=31998 RepID=UPI0038D0E5EC
MKFLDNLRLLAKLAIPSLVLVAVSAGMILLARGSLTRLDANTQEIVDRSAQRAILSLQLAVAIDEATIREKNLIIEGDGPNRQVLRGQHAEDERAAREAVDHLLQLSDTPERRIVNEKLKELADRFLATSKAAVDMVLRNEVTAATALSNGDGRAARREAVEATRKRVDANVDALKEEKRQAAEVAAAATQTLTLVAVLGLTAAFGLLGAIAVFGITRPLNGLVGVLERMARGETDAVIPEAARGDEIGAVGRAVRGIKAMVAQKAAEEAEVQRIADEAAAAERRRTMVELADGFERAVGGIVGTVSSAATELQATARTMSSAAAETASQSTAVAAAAEEASSNVTTVAAASEELGSSVQEIGRQVAGSADLAQRAVTEADRTGMSVQGLSAAVSRIGDVVGLIQNIAGQTNLLALNATIEAARAGESGRGFAVVAAEVKELANQTARATEEISGQIAGIQASTAHAVSAIGSITERIRQINGVATAIAAAVEEQGAATQEIVRNVGQAAAGTAEVTGNIAGVAGTAEETGAAAAQVLASASELSRQSETLSGEVARFLATVRTA